MNCKKARQLIQLAADNQLDGDQRNILIDHIHVCEDCARLYDTQVSIATNIGNALHMAVSQVHPTADFAQRISAALADDMQSQRTFSRRFAAAFNWDRILSTPRTKVAVACLTVITACCFTTAYLNHYAHAPSVATSQFSSGRLVSFTIRPQEDGNALAGVGTHTYCKIQRNRIEGFR